MNDPPVENGVTKETGGEPGRSRLRQILDERPEARPRLGNAFAWLLGTILASVAIVSALLIWHLSRRARLIREGLNPPRDVELHELPPREARESP
jgi:predicted outer membrane lipoprotein